MTPYKVANDSQQCLSNMVRSTLRRKRMASSCASAAICWLMVMTNLQMTAARTWDTVVDSSVYIVLDDSMIQETEETDPIITRTNVDSGNSTSPEPGRLETAAPSTSPSPTVTPAPSRPLYPTTSPRPSSPGPTGYYNNPDPNEICAEGEILHDVRMFDVWGDGWNGRNLTFTIKASPHVITKAVNVTEGNTTTVVYKTTVLNESDNGGNLFLPGTRTFEKTFQEGLVNGYDYACIRPGVCYQATIPGGLWSDEILWEVRQTQYAVNPLDNNGLIIAKGGAPSSCDFSLPDEASGYTLCKTTCTSFPGDPTSNPTLSPTGSPWPSSVPTRVITPIPSAVNTINTTVAPTGSPSAAPTILPTQWPTRWPTREPTQVRSSISPSSLIPFPANSSPPAELSVGWPTQAPSSISSPALIQLPVNLSPPAELSFGWPTLAPPSTSSPALIQFPVNSSPPAELSVGWPTQTPSSVSSPSLTQSPVNSSPPTDLTVGDPSSISPSPVLSPSAPTELSFGDPGSISPSTLLSPSTATSSPTVVTNLAPGTNLPSVAVPETPPPSPPSVVDSDDETDTSPMPVSSTTSPSTESTAVPSLTSSSISPATVLPTIVASPSTESTAVLSLTSSSISPATVLPTTVTLAAPTLILPGFGGFGRNLGKEEAGEITGDAGDESAVSSAVSSGKKRE